MKMIRTIVCLLITVTLLFGCSGDKKGETKVNDPKYDPALHIEHYEKLNALIGTERLAALKELGYELSDTTFEHWWHLELPMKATIADVVFAVHLSIEDRKGDAEDRVQSFSYQKNYRYPEEKDLAIRETMAVCSSLNEMLGPPDAVDSWNDWLEEEAATELDQDIPAWQSEEQLAEIFDHDMYWGGDIIRWDVTGYCTDNYKQFAESNGWELTDAIWVDVERVGGDSIQLTIYF